MFKNHAGLHAKARIDNTRHADISQVQITNQMPDLRLHQPRLRERKGHRGGGSDTGLIDVPGGGIQS